MSDIDELFGEGGGAPAPRTVLASGLIATGLLTALVGMVCSAAPGALLVLLGWYVVEKDAARVESGYLPATAAPTVRALRVVAVGAVLGVIAMFVVQEVLLRVGVYDGPWSAAFGWIESVRPHLPPPDVDPNAAPVPLAPPSGLQDPLDVPSAPIPAPAPAPPAPPAPGP